MFEEFAHGAHCLFMGFTWLTRPGIKRHVIIPLLINLLLFTAAIALGAHYFGAWLHHWTAGLPHWLAWFAALLWVIFALAAVMVLFYVFALATNIIGAPFCIFLSMRVETLLTGRRPKTGRSVAEDIGVALRGQVQRILYILWRAILIGLLGLLLLFVPLFGIVTPLLWFLFSAWTLAILYSDFPLSNSGVAFAAQRPLFRRHRSRLFGFGAAATLCTLIPVVNFIIMPAAVAGATVMWVEIRRRNPLARCESDSSGS
ncbi:MAG: sulfate transporter CysZ [Gammaproteobacteria bacterium]